MLKGKMSHWVSKDGCRYVHIIPDGGVFNIYYQKEGYPMFYAFGLPNYQLCDGSVYDLDDALEIGWNNFSDYEYLFDEDGVYDE